MESLWNHNGIIKESLNLTLIGWGQSPIYRLRYNHHDYVLKVRLQEQGDTREDLMLAQLNHPGIVRCYGKYDAPDYLRRNIPGAWQILLLDYIPGSQLRYLEVNPDFSAAMANQIMRDLFDILGYLESKNMVHRDIHRNNILYTPEGHVVLIDFEYATVGIPDPNPDLFSVLAIGDLLAGWIRVGNAASFRRRLDRIRQFQSTAKIRRFWCQAAL